MRVDCGVDDYELTIGRSVLTVLVKVLGPTNDPDCHSYTDTPIINNRTCVAIVAIYVYLFSTKKQMFPNLPPPPCPRLDPVVFTR